MSRLGSNRSLWGPGIGDSVRDRDELADSDFIEAVFPLVLVNCVNSQLPDSKLEFTPARDPLQKIESGTNIKFYEIWSDASSRERWSGTWRLGHRVGE
jgi:hypothetical protein